MMVLVVYAGWYGSTGDIAAVIGATLAQPGWGVVVRPAAEVMDISGYDAVIIGTAIRAGSPHPAAIAFAQRHRTALARVPVACFSVGIIGLDTESKRQKVATFLDKIRAHVTPVATTHFVGIHDPAMMGWSMRLWMKFMREPKADAAYWDNIRTWAAFLPTVFGQKPAQVG